MRNKTPKSVNLCSWEWRSLLSKVKEMSVSELFLLVPEPSSYFYGRHFKPNCPQIGVFVKLVLCLFILVFRFVPTKAEFGACGVTLSCVITEL